MLNSWTKIFLSQYHIKTNKYNIYWTFFVDTYSVTAIINNNLVNIKHTASKPILTLDLHQSSKNKVLKTGSTKGEI